MKSKKKLSLIIIIVIVVLGYTIFKKFNPTNSSSVYGQLSDKEIKVLVDKVSKLINVPDEIPVIATIVKADQLIVEQKFYVGSKDGDYLMVFPKAQKAIIYRENEDRLINVGPIIIDQPAAATQQTVTTTQPVLTSTSEKVNTKTKDR